MGEYQKIAQFLWVGGSLSAIERLALASFRDHGFECHLYHYYELIGVPDGIALKDAREIISDDAIFYTDSPSGRSLASFSDLFRYALLSKCGGWWFDMDVVCLRSADTWMFNQSLIFASTYEGEYGECASNCVIYAPTRNDERMVELRQLAQALSSVEGRDFCAMGPFLIQQIVRDNNLGSSVAPFWAFCPYPWRLIELLVFRGWRAMLINVLRRCKHLVRSLTRKDFEAAYIRRHSLTLHLHNEIFKAKGIDKNGTYSPWCTLERLKRRHGVA